MAGETQERLPALISQLTFSAYFNMTRPTKRSAKRSSLPLIVTALPHHHHHLHHHHLLLFVLHHFPPPSRPLNHQPNILSPLVTFKPQNDGESIIQHIESKERQSLKTNKNDISAPCSTPFNSMSLMRSSPMDDAAAILVLIASL